MPDTSSDPPGSLGFPDPLLARSEDAPNHAVLPQYLLHLFALPCGHGTCSILFGAFLLISFHFPLPDRFRWDFWRWLVLLPASLCFMHALLLWRTVSADVSLMPWGSAIGAESDGDMNRLVQRFGWNANELADFYLGAAYLGLAAMVFTYGYAAFRVWKNRASKRSAS